MRSLAMAVMFLASCHAASAAGTAAGIVMNVSGPAAASWPMMTEIPSGTVVPVGPDSELTFLHYGKCELVTVAGGTLTMTGVGYVTDGRIESEKNGPCPRFHALGSGASAGAIVTRGITAPTRFPVDPEIIFVGSRAGRVTAAAIYAEGQPDQPLVRLQFAGARATMPASRTPLVPNARYLLRVSFADRTQLEELPFIGVAPGTGGTLVILRAD